MSRLSALLLLALAAPAGALETMYVMVPQAAGAPAKSVEVVKGQALVRYSSAAAPGVSSALSAAGAKLGKHLGHGWAVVDLPSGMLPTQAVPWLKGQPGVLDAEYNQAHRPIATTTNDPLLASQYGLEQISAKQAWDYESGSSARVTIAVIDSGVESAHVDLSSRIINITRRAFDAGTGAASNDVAAPACNHGTRVAGIAAAQGNNGTQISGVAWGSGIQIASMRVFNTGTCTVDCDGGGCVTSDAAIAAAINEVRTSQGTTWGRTVINMSLGGGGACSGSLQTAVTDAVAAGIVLVAAAGNGGGAVESPGNCSGVIPVGATDAAGEIASFSSRGPELASGGLVAPGVSVLSTDLSNGTVNGISGTSFSSPHVAGAAALILAAKPAYTPAQVLATLRNSADPVGFGTAAVPAGFKTQGNSSGAGRLNAFLALQLAVKGQLADFQGEDKVVAFPNPFRADRHQNVTFAFPPSLQSASDVTIRIFTLDGALVRDLNGLTWNVKNDEGRPVASGTYLYVVSTSRGKRTGRVSVLR